MERIGIYNGVGNPLSLGYTATGTPIVRELNYVENPHFLFFLCFLKEDYYNKLPYKTTGDGNGQNINKKEQCYIPHFYSTLLI
jgi:hypothetical protein